MPPPEAAAVARPVAIVVSRFPVVTETFILRELDELERQGIPVVLVPLQRQSPKTVHPQAIPWMDRALFTPWLDARIARDLAAELLRRPLRTTGLLARCAWDARTSLNALGGVLAFFAKSVSLGRRLRRLGVAHVHAHFATHPGFAALVMSTLGGENELPYSITAHAHDLFVSQAGLRTKVARSAFTRCISAFNVRFLEERLGPAAPRSKLPVIHCGLELQRYEPAPPLPPSGALRVLCVASLQPYKGVRHLVDAVRLARERGLRVRCTVIGDGPLREELQRHVAACGLEGDVTLAGTRTQEEVARALRECDAFVLPSVVAPDGQMEGLPVALMEALACCVPVISTRLSGIPELVRPAETGFLVEPGDAPGLAAAMQAVARDPAAARAMAERGRELVRREFDLRRCVGELAERLLVHGAAAEGEPAELARSAAAVLGASRAGVVSVSDGRDALVAEVLVPPGRRVVVKRHRDRPGASSPASVRARREHEALATLHAEGLAVPAALGLDEASATVVMERATGRPSSAAFRAARRDPQEALAVSGAAWFWLDQLRHAQGPPRDAREFAPEAVIARLRRELRDDADECLRRGFPQRLVKSLRLRAHRELPEAVPRQTCWSHGDFWPGNVLVTWREGWEVGRITVIDLEGLRAGLPLEDAATFLEHVALSLPSLLSLSRWDRPREQIESVLLVGHGESATIPQALRIAKALRLAARTPGLLGRPSLRREALRLRLLARLLEVRW